MFDYALINAFWGFMAGACGVLLFGLIIDPDKEKNKQIMKNLLIVPFMFAICAALASLPFYGKNKKLHEKMFGKPKTVLTTHIKS